MTLVTVNEQLHMGTAVLREHMGEGPMLTTDRSGKHNLVEIRLNKDEHT